MRTEEPQTAPRNPLVTVLIDTYNYGQFIEEAINSVLSQDFPSEEMEVLVVDDGSTDDTAERVKSYRDRVKYLYKQNGGQASAFNYGLAMARGEIVAFLDADDTWLPGKLRRVVQEFQKYPEAEMVYHQSQELDTSTGTRTLGSFSAVSGNVPADREKLLSYILYPTSVLAFRKRCLDRLLPIPEGLTIQADGHLSGLAIFLAPVVAIEEPLAVYRQHGDNLFHTVGSDFDAVRFARRHATREILIDGMKGWLKANGYDAEEPNTRAWFTQWFLTQERDEFTLRPPGRLQCFRHLCRYTFYFAPQLSKRHMLVNYLNAFGTLVVGYEHVGQLDRWRATAKRLLGFVPKPAAGSASNRSVS
jgi:glycosyltransferase involved in cell wall biosynthesis